MTYQLLKFAHLAGLMLIGGGLIGVFLADLRSRRTRDLAVFAEAVRNIALFYDGVVVPGALLLAGSGVWLIAAFHDGWGFWREPWLLGMVVLFVFEFVEGNTVTRLHFMRLGRETRRAVAEGGAMAAVERLRGRRLPTFTHFLDLPLLLVIVSLGAMRPQDWGHFVVGSAAALGLAALLMAVLAGKEKPLSGERGFVARS